MTTIAESIQSQPSKATLTAASFWGVAVWFPVGLSYIALLMTWICLLSSSNMKQRWQQVQSTPIFTAALFFACWVVFSFILHPGGELALTMLFHVLLFVLTLFAGLMLLPDEARAAWRTFLITTLVMLSLLLIHVFIISLPRLPGIYNVLVYDGNKSIRAGLLMCLAAAVAISYLMWTPGLFTKILTKTKSASMLWLALVVFFAASLTVIFYIPSRTSTLLLPMAIFVIYLHRKVSLSKALVAGFVIVVLSVSMYHVSKNTHNVVEQGVSTLINDVEKGHPSSSVGLRYHFYKFSLKNMLEHPLAGMGPGRWHSKWAALEPDYGWFANPHNDYLLFGSESGLPALLALFVIYALFFINAFRIHTMWGSIATATAFVAALTAMFNAGMRDAVFCCSLVWLMATAYSAAKKDS